MKKYVSNSKLTIFFVAAALAGCGGGSSGTAISNATTDNVAALSWNAPATRVNGEGLSMGELDAYVILYGQDADNLDRAITVGEASTMSFTIPDLAAGDWYFAIQVVDTQGLVSAPSRVVSKSI